MISRRDVLRTTPTTRHRPAPPVPAAAPAPGAVPLPDNNVELRRQFDEFFRAPNENGAIPTPAPPAPVPTNGITAGPTLPAPTMAEPPVTEEDRIQTSIWGGPIQPGRFFAPPLGSIRPSQPQSRAGPSRSRPVPIPIRATEAIHSDNMDRPPQSAFPIPTPSRHGLNSPIPGSEATTPFSSNPPEVFRSMSSGSEESGVEVSGSSKDVEVEGGRGNRRLAAEAAMRRMGLVRPGSKGKEKEKVTSEINIPEVITKETKVETYTPYLSPLARSAPHSNPAPERSSAWQRRPMDHGAGAGRGGIRAGVEERLQTLKRVDDTIWGLVEELTRIRSLMDDEARSEGDMVDRVDG